MIWNWIEFWTGLTAVATAILAVITMAAVKTARRTLKQMRDDSVAQTRPYVYVDVVPGLAGMQTWDVVIRNVGQSSARNVVVSVDDWPELEDDNIVESLKPLFDAPKTLPPSCTIRAIWRMELEKGATWDSPHDHSGMPEKTTFTVRYDSDDASHGGYVDSYFVDIKALGYTPIPESGWVAHDGMSRTTRQFYHLFGLIARNVREISR